MNLTSIIFYSVLGSVVVLHMHYFILPQTLENTYDFHPTGEKTEAQRI